MIISIIAVVVSAISIIVSIITAIFAYKQQTRLNRINMRAKYFEKIFDEYLIEYIPKARKYLRFENNKLVDSEQLCQTLSDLLNASLYFRYENGEFYKELKTQIQSIEDYVLKCGNQNYEQEEQGKVFEEIHNKLSGLYKYINDNYVGK